MNIVSWDWNMEVLLNEGGLSEIFVAGCTIRCPGCHNKALQSFKIGMIWDEYLELCKDDLSDHVAIMGGEPLDQNKAELTALVRTLKARGHTIWLFTGYSKDHFATKFQSLEKYVTYLKSGPYKENLNSKFYPEFNITLASNNQSLFKINSEEKTYTEIDIETN